MLCAFKSCLLFLVALSGFTTLCCTVPSFKCPAMNVHDVATKELDTELFSQHTIANMNSGITFIFLLSQEKSLR